MRSIVTVLGLLLAATSAAKAKTQPKPAVVSMQSRQPERSNIKLSASQSRRLRKRRSGKRVSMQLCARPRTRSALAAAEVQSLR